jgi:hypothetical protein
MHRSHPAILAEASIGAMGFLDRILGRGTAENLPKLPTEVEEVNVGKLQVRTAAEWVMVIASPDAADQLLDAARTRRARRLHPGGRPLTVVPVKRDTRIVLDPKIGWVLPLTEVQADALTASARSEPGEYEIEDLGVALVVEKQ